MSALTYQDVLDILRIIDSGSFSDFEIEFEGTRVKVSRAASAAAPANPTSSAAPAPAKAAAPQAAKSAPAAKPPVSKLAAKRPPVAIPNGVEVKPPMAGTFYCAPAPGALPFVEVGSPVKKGDQLGIVEVMKLFTSVLSPCEGTVRAILVGNEEFVEADQTLMVIEASQ